MVTGWKMIYGKKYYFNKNGIMQTGLKQVGDRKYFFKRTGILAAAEWCKGYCVNADGSVTYPYRASWGETDGKRWYGDSSGWRARGTVKIDGYYYSFDSAGYL
jgi:glucan-binding YG repeat protein